MSGGGAGAGAQRGQFVIDGAFAAHIVQLALDRSLAGSCVRTVERIAGTLLERLDTAKPEDVISKLKPLATPGAAWFPHAAELLAAAYLEQDKPDLAGPWLGESAKDDDAPSSLQSRARQLAGVLGFDAVEDPEELVEEVAAEQGEGAPQDAPAEPAAAQ